jgi:DNA end-binding protein Ku
MAEKLIEEMTEPWKPQQYRDTYREDLMKRINEKVRNKETHTLTEPGEAEKPRKTAEIIDLMAVLKQSLEKGGRGGARKTARRATARHGRRKAARG